MARAFLVISEEPVDHWGRCIPTVEEVDPEAPEAISGKVFFEDDPFPPVRVITPDDPRVGLKYIVVSFLEGGIDSNVLEHVDPQDIEEALEVAKKHPWIAVPGTIGYLEEYLQNLKQD